MGKRRRDLVQDEFDGIPSGAAIAWMFLAIILAIVGIAVAGAWMAMWLR